MSSITNASTSLLNPISVQAQSQNSLTSLSATPQAANSNTASNDSFGSAVTVTLSPAAQAIVNGGTPQAGAATVPEDVSAAASTTVSSSAGTQSAPPPVNDSTGNTTSGSGSGSASAKPAGGGGGGGGVSVADTTDVTLVKQQVAAQVGQVAANEVVDQNGNIDHARLNEILKEQAALAAAAKQNA